MLLEQSFRRLALRPSKICRQCRQTFASSAQVAQQQQSATSALADALRPSRPQNIASRSASSTRTQAAGHSGNTTPGFQNPYDFAANTIRQIDQQTKRSALRAERQRLVEERKEYEQQLSRRWKIGDVYSPHDLSGVEMSKWRRIRRKPRVRSGGKDVLDQLGINPIDHYKNFSMMAEYVSETGRIKHGNETGLRPVNQRRMAKAIRRAIGMGLMPSVYRHPELLRLEYEARNQ